MIRRIAALALAALAIAGLAACGSKKEAIDPSGAESLRVMLDFFPNADHAGIYAAQASGEFRRAALDVHLLTPPDPSQPLKLLAAGKIDLAVSYEPELLLARDRGAQLVAVGAIAQKPLTSIISLDSAKIHRPADLRGKKVGTAGIPYQSAYLRTILSGARVDPRTVREINVGFNLVPAMLSKRVDATLGGYWSYEGVQLALKGKKPNIIHVEQAGVPSYQELVLVARRVSLAAQGGKVRRFVQALGRGYASLRSNSRPAIDALVKANPEADRRLQEASLRAVLPAFFPPAGRPFGYQDPRSWDAYGNWMLRNRLVRRQPNAGHGALTNEFLAGQGA